MKNNNSKIVLEHRESEFLYEKNKTKLKISFNRIAFIFFTFFIIFLVYSIHLVHLGSRKDSSKNIQKFTISNDKLYRADIVDRNGNYLSKSIRSIDVGISPRKIIDEKKLIINLKYIFPDKNYKKIKDQIEKGKFFYLEKKISYENYDKLMLLGDKSIESRDNLSRVYPQKNLFSHIIGQIGKIFRR